MVYGIGTAIFANSLVLGPLALGSDQVEVIRFWDIWDTSDQMIFSEKKKSLLISPKEESKQLQERQEKERKRAGKKKRNRLEKSPIFNIA